MLGNTCSEKIQQTENKHSKCRFPAKPLYASIDDVPQCIAIIVSDKISAHIPKTKVSPDALNGWNLK